MSQASPGLLDYIRDNFALLIVVALFLVGGFVVGSLWTENQMLKSGVTGPAGVAGQPQAPEFPLENPTAVPAVSEADYFKGNPETAAVTIVEYSDMRCGFCKQFHSTMQTVVDDYAGQVAWVYRHLPVLGSQKQAEAAECAGKLGGQTAFWNYLDSYFEEIAGTPNSSDEDNLIPLATSLGLDTNAFSQCLNSGEFAEKVNADAAGAASVGISGTPGSVIIVNGEGVETIGGALPIPDVKNMIDQYL